MNISRIARLEGEWADAIEASDRDPANDKLFQAEQDAYEAQLLAKYDAGLCSERGCYLTYPCAIHDIEEEEEEWQN